MKSCENCRTQCEDKASFCIGCGNAFGAAENLGTQPPKLSPEQAKTYTSAQAPNPVLPLTNVPVHARDSLNQLPEQQILQPTYKPLPSSTDAKFVQNYLGLIVIGIIILLVLLLVMLATFLSGQFSTLSNLINILRQFLIMGSIALGTVVATRIKGPDLSMGSVMALSGIIVAFFATEGIFGNTGNLLIGILLAILVCFIVGLLNGVFISLLNTPAIATTVVTAALVRGIAVLCTNGSPIQLTQMGHFSFDPSLITFIAFILSVIIAFIALLIAKRMPVLKSNENRISQKMVDLLGYGFVAIIAGLSGLAILFRISSALPYTASGYEINIIIVFAAIQLSQLLKNNLSAMVFGLFTALIIVVLQNILMLLGVSAYFSQIVQVVVALLLLGAAGAARGRWASNLNSNLMLKSTEQPNTPTNLADHYRGSNMQTPQAHPQPLPQKGNNLQPNQQQDASKGYDQPQPEDNEYAIQIAEKNAVKRHCGNCGKQLGHEEQFCMSCGQMRIV